MKFVSIKSFIFRHPNGGQVPPFKAGAHLMLTTKGKIVVDVQYRHWIGIECERGTVTLHDSARATFNNVPVSLSSLVIGHQFV